jgi:hypothetical protein
MGQYWGLGMCKFQAFYLVCWMAANTWLNVLATYEVYRLLQSSNIQKKYNPPTKLNNVQNSMICYAFAFFLSAWGLIHIQPMNVDAQSGLFCLMVMETQVDLIFYYHSVDIYYVVLLQYCLPVQTIATKDK